MRSLPIGAALLTILGALALVIAASAWPAAAPAEEGPPPAAASSGWGSDCRWEIVPLESRFWPEQAHPSGITPTSRTVLLDQCSGVTWLLIPEGGPREAVWRRLEREGR